MTAVQLPDAGPLLRTPQASTPARAAGVELMGELQGSGYRQTPSLVRRRDGQTLQLTPLLYAVLAAIDGRRDRHLVAVEASRRTGRHLSAEDVEFLVEEKLRPLGLVRGHDGSEPRTQPSNPLLALRFRFVISDRRVTTRITRPFAALFRGELVTLALLAFGWVVWRTLFGGALGSAIEQTFHDPVALLAVTGLTILSVGFHEFGHAAACLYGGARPGALGVGLYLVWPAFYTDVTDSYRLSRGGRLRVDLGGLYFNVLFALVTYGMWSATSWDPLLLLIVTQLVQMARQLIPVVRFDGYHILADLTGVPDLFHHIRPTLLGLVPGRVGRAYRPGPLRPWARAIVTLWVLVVVPLLLLVFGAMIATFPRLAATAWEGAAGQAGALVASWRAGHLAEVGVAAVSTLTLLTPVAAIAYLAARVARRVGRRIWLAAGRDPRRRAGAFVLVAVAAAVVAALWWPQGQYRPVDSERDRTITDLVAARRALPAGADILTAASPSADAGEQDAPAVAAPDARTRERVPATVPAQPAPTSRTQPRTDVTDGPTVVAARPAEVWPFPWPRPGPPVAGDNRAYVVNTRDGTTRHDVRIDDRWVTGGRAVMQRNEAWALASCVDCRTVAVAYQAIFIIGNSDLIAPANLSRAANVECERCVTRAVADQLVLTLTRAPDGETRGRIEAVLGRLRQLKGRAPGMTPAEIQGVLAGASREIEDIVAGAGLLPPKQEDTSPEASSEPQDEASASPSDEASPTEQPGASEEPSPNGEPTTSDEPSEQPSGEQEPSPDEEPTEAPSEDPAASEESAASQDPSNDPSPAEEPSDGSTSPSPEPSPSSSEGTSGTASGSPERTSD